MAAIKFSKQYIEPNPNEIDYWVDLSSNQYGGRMKYYNGFEWVDLVNPDGTHIDINDFYNKLQINQMLSQKASVDSVESKVDDDEVSDVIKNISFSQRGEDGVEMVMFKYDDTTVGIQLPIADNTKSGIITKDTFKNLVNQTQLQQLYSEMYTKLSEIRNNYQPKLRAGANIKIENNVISAVSKIGTDWNDIANKPDIYDKSQVDTMMSGVYKIKGSRRFEALPLYTNTVGDTYNITNDFSLHGEDYPMGTNVVWTENGWDALAGIFDTSELEEDIQEVKDNYLPLSGGRLNSGTDTPLVILGTDHSWIGFKNSNGTDLGWIGVLTNKLPSFYSDKGYKIWYEGNFNPDDYLPLSGGTLTSSDVPLKINRTSTEPKIGFLVNGTNVGYIGFDSDENLILQKDLQYKIYHEGNDGEGSGLDADTLDGLLGSNYLHPVAYISNQDFNVPYGLDDSGGGYNNYIFSISSDDKQTNRPVEYGVMMSINNGAPGMEFATNGPLGYSTLLKFRKRWLKNFSSWKTVAFTDSNVASATKLATPVKLWGNNFDGSGDINGRMRMLSNDGLHDSWFDIIDGYLCISASKINANYTGISLCPYGGNVGIGINAPAYKLDVNGAISCKDHLLLGSKVAITDDIGKNYLLFGSYSYDNYVRGRSIYFQFGEDGQVASLSSKGNVGIGTTDPLAKLDVVGGVKASSNLRVTAELGTTIVYPWGIDINADNPAIAFMFAKGGEITSRLIEHSAGVIACEADFKIIRTLKVGDHIYLDNNKTIIAKSTDNIDCGLISLNSWNSLNIGYGVAHQGYDTYVDGNNLYFRYGTTHTNGIILNSSGNVTIGSGDYASTNHRLYVAGSAVVSYRAYINDNLVVDKQITSGDLVDWYGVSWSEDSSDPTCTRIGNMALHRSLPIQSAMKGYMITTKNANFADGILPLDNDWNKTRYSMNSNDGTAVAAVGHFANMMVKIPEFWYIDEYEPSTKTHNLKISQTAKAGWCHHKEAYVGAYEGYHDGELYRSGYGSIPTVSQTREQLRTAARANGYEDEYKWNIYTYEEHRAICHLFLVEYATRNSQAPVNTALTADGFKQGGLGSGCTTGTMDGAYVFIPTGTTDSLGNGSGQVAYTASNGTTYYANRYRGIENPFGHIWKHVDDIVNVYNAETTYKTVYKCDKPEHFATYKNAKYKPLCSFPGGSKMQGYSKEIKATINCDFFKYSIGGDQNTYWCDYNYDSDSTTENCLLIGCNAAYGGAAGLFSFALIASVYHSATDIGSRLTYLPWAE